MICGRGLADRGAEYCPDCAKYGKHYAYDRGLALCDYDEVMRNLIYRFKYEGRREYGEVFGRLMAKRLGKAVLRAGADGIIPVPVHPKRLHRRGYNQAKVLAKSFGDALDIPVYDRFVERCENTIPMKNLSPAERQKNLENAFKIGQNDVKLNVTIIMDDIYTTGATMNAMAGLLKAHGIKRVYFLTMAIGGEVF